MCRADLSQDFAREHPLPQQMTPSEAVGLAATPRPGAWCPSPTATETAEMNRFTQDRRSTSSQPGRSGFVTLCYQGFCLYQFGFRWRKNVRTVGESESTVTRLLIADEHDMVRSGLRAMLEARPDWEVVAEAADGKEAISKAIETKPDVAVIDYLLPLVNGIDVTRRIRARLRKTEVLVLTVDDSKALIEAPLKAGARGFLTTSEAQHYLIEDIESLATHRPFFTPNVAEALLASFLARPNRRSALSNRERVVLKLVVEGHSNRQTAAILDICIKTVETHRAAIMRKLNLHSHAGLVRYAVRNKLVEP
jgi:DNA-binding NarL/FixJ family response regulator